MKRLNGISGFFTAAALAASTSFAATFAQAQPAPDALIKTVAAEVITVLKTDPAILSNAAKLKELIESKLIPNFSFARMTQLAMGRNWAKATAEQQVALTREFQTLLVRTYSTALSNYRDQVIEYKPLRAAAGDAEVTVKSEVKQSGTQAITIDYDMEKTPTGWKVYDVRVGGVSLVANYRTEFANEIRSNGIDGLIRGLVSKNRGSAQRAERK